MYSSDLPPERQFFTDDLLVRIHFIIVMIRWTGLAPWEFEFPFPSSLIFTFPTCSPPAKIRMVNFLVNCWMVGDLSWRPKKHESE